MKHLMPVIEALQRGDVSTEVPHIKVYERSHARHDGAQLLMVKDRLQKRLLAVGEGPLFDELEGTELGADAKACPLSHHNRLVLNRYFDYTVPQAFGPQVATIGLGDRLGLASPGHIDTVSGKEIKPVLAQQSVRELTLTNRTFEDVLDACCFAVFQEGYKGGFGADGDHLKEEADIRIALQLGMSMLTLDSSDQIHNEIETASFEDIRSRYDQLSPTVKERYEKRYLGQTFQLNGLSLAYDKPSLMKYVLLYKDAIDYMIHVYIEYIRRQDRFIDFEVSIDETETVTTPLAHFFVAYELQQANVEMTSLAPRFCGEFQKGIDYIGDIDQFERELNEHAMIADHFGYKLSIHSGSDKFTVFPLIAKYTQGRFHLKTAGTNWLEAVRVIGETNPDLYRRMHRYALDHFDEALQYYHITPDLAQVEPLEQVADRELPQYMDNDAARQLLHVTYGLLLTAQDDHGRALFRDEFFATLNEREDVYRQALIRHIGNHLRGLGI